MQSEIRGTEEVNDTFKKFFAQPSNTKCFECDAEAKEFVSVNNGISLCEKCAGVHRSFGDHISLVKSIQSPEWTSSELKLLEHGGNAKLKEFFSSYSFDAKAAPIIKYKTLAAFYYRRKLRFESEGKEHPELSGEKDKHLEEHENESFFESLTAGLTGLKDNAKDLASQGIAAVKTGVSNAVEFIKEKTHITNTDEAKEALIEKKDEVKKDLKDTKDAAAEKIDEKAGGIRETITDAKDKAVDLASKGIEAVKGQVSNATEFIKGTTSDIKENLLEKKETAGKMIGTGVEAAQEQAVKLGENLTGAKDKAVDLASKGYEAVKGQVSNATEYIKETTSDIKENLLEKKETAGKMLGSGVEAAQEKVAKLGENMTDVKDKAMDMASKGIEAVKEQVSNAVEFIKEKSHPEDRECDNKECTDKECSDKKCEEGDKKESAKPEKELKVSDVVHKSEEQLKQEREVAEKRAKEEAELQNIANDAAETIKAQTMPHTTKSKADQIREQAAMIEAARGKTRVSKGKGVKKQVVQKGSADPEYIEKLQHAGEEEHKDDDEEYEEGDEEHEEQGQEQSKDQSKEQTKETAGDSKKESKEVKTPATAEKKDRLSTLAQEAKKEVKEHDPSKPFDKEENETFPQGKPQGKSIHTEAKSEKKEGDKPLAEDKSDAKKEGDKKESGEKKDEEKPEAHSLRETIKETALGGLETLKETAQNTVDWIKGKVGAPLQKDAEHHAAEHHAAEVQEKAGEIKEKVDETVDSLKEGEAASIGQKIKEKIVGGMEMAKDKALDAAEWVQSKVGLGEEGAKTTEEGAKTTEEGAKTTEEAPRKVSTEERKEGAVEKGQKISK